MPLKALISAGFLCLLPLITCAQSDNFTRLRILQKYSDNYGGGREADALTSLSVEGTIEQNGSTYIFLMRRKRPYGFRYRLSDKGGVHSAIIGYDGRKGWMRSESNGEMNLSEIKGPALEALREQAHFDGPLFRHFENSESSVSLLGRRQLDGEPVYVIQVESSVGRRFHYFLHPSKAHILRIDALDSDGEITSTTLYRNYQEVDGVPFAYEIETIVEGERVSLAQVGKMAVNPGLLSIYFEMPSR